MSAAKTFARGDSVLVRLSSGSCVWHPATYLGEYTIYWGSRPWHQLQLNADKHIVPINRIRRAA